MAPRTNSNVRFVSNSERTCFKRCRFQWYWTYMRRLKPKTAAAPLRFGSLIHGALEAYYKPGRERGPHPAKTFEQLYAEELKEQHGIGFRDEDGKWAEAGELGVSMLTKYTEEYGADDEWEVLAAEHRFESPVVSSRGNIIGVFVGVIDLVMRNLSRRGLELEIWDHKGVKTIDTSYLLLDDQPSSYWTYGVDELIRQGLLESAKHLNTIRFNFLRKALPDERNYRLTEKGRKIYLNQNGSDSKQQPSDYFVRHPVPRTEAERALTRESLVGELRDIRLTEQGKLDIYKSPGKFNCMGCAVKDICELHQVGADYEELARLTMVPKGQWKPSEYIKEAIEFEHSN